MPNVTAILRAAQTIDENPECLRDERFSEHLAVTVSSIKGDFSRRAVDRGIDRSSVERWLAETQSVASRSLGDVDVEKAADLAVRLYAISFIVSEAASPLDVEPAELLAQAATTGSS